MKPLIAIISFICILKAVPLHGQEQPLKYDSTQLKIKTAINIPDSAKISKTKHEARQTLKNESQEIRSSVKNQLTQSLPDTTKPDTKKISQTAKEKLTDKATNLEYNSDNPEDAPWKKQQFSKDDLKDLDLPSKPGAPSLNNDKLGTYKEKIENLKPSSIDEKKVKDAVSKVVTSEELDKAKQAADKIEKASSMDEKQLQDEVTKKVNAPKIEKARKTADSLIAIHDRIEASGLQQEVLGATRVYSEKYIKKIYDSLGMKKADSIFKVAAGLAKTQTPKDELIKRINTPLKEKAGKEGVSFDEENQSLRMEDAEKLNGLPGQFSEMDLASMQLPQEVLSELAPLTGNLTDSKYVPIIDSLRDVYMKAKGYSLDEKQVTEELKKTLVKKKPSFLDKSYFEGILGFVNDSTISIVQFSPAWAYHFTDHISAGLGPNISLLYQESKLKGVVGYRSFVKSEFWKQRVYAQLEDNFMPAKFNSESIQKMTYHSILLGGGGLLPISKKLAINASVFYRVNQEQVRPGGSPWVFRIGLSSVKKIGKD